MYEPLTPASSHSSRQASWVAFHRRSRELSHLPGDVLLIKLLMEQATELNESLQIHLRELSRQAEGSQVYDQIVAWYRLGEFQKQAEDPAALAAFGSSTARYLGRAPADFLRNLANGSYDDKLCEAVDLPATIDPFWMVWQELPVVVHTADWRRATQGRRLEDDLLSRLLTS